jgi:DNA polymerase delta subunit 3
LQILSDATREILDVYADEDPLQYAKTYGTIQSMNIRRRKGGRPTTIPASAPAITQRKPAPIQNTTTDEDVKTTSHQSQLGSKNSQSSSANDFFSKKSTGEKPSAMATKPKTTASLKRDSSSIFKSFAKAKPKVSREETVNSASVSATESPVSHATEDSPMKDVSEDEEDSYELPVQDPKVDGQGRKARMEREAALKKMMEDDEDEEVSQAPSTQVSEAVENPNIKSATEESREVTPVVSGGRRRGKRRLIKKKKVKDEEGYLGMCFQAFEIITLANLLCSHEGGGGMGILLGR